MSSSDVPTLKLRAVPVLPCLVEQVHVDKAVIASGSVVTVTVFGCGLNAEKVVVLLDAGIERAVVDLVGDPIPVLVGRRRFGRRRLGTHGLPDSGQRLRRPG